MSKLDALFLQQLDEAESRHVRRRLRRVEPSVPGRIVLDGRTLLNFSSNDYLGLARHPALCERAREWADAYGTGAQASRLVCGNLTPHETIEAKIAQAKGTEAAVLLASGWQANAAILPALLRVARARGEPRVYTDRLNHASLHHGCQAAGVRQIRFLHNDLDHLESLLQAQRLKDDADGTAGASFIVTESVFSMDGDRVDVIRLADIARRYDAFVYLDEAHATGVLGPEGMGLAALAPSGIDLAMGTFSKAMGSFGAYIAGSRAMCDYLINTCSGFIYTTALPPQVLGAIDAALDLVPTLDDARVKLAARADRLRAGLHRLGIDTADSSTHIVPAMIGDAQRALEISAALQRAGFLVIAIRPPTVPAGTSRLRIALSAAHGDDDVDALLAALAEIIGRSTTIDGQA